MALGSKTHPYVHSNFFNFTGKAFNDFIASKQGIEFSNAVQKKKQELEVIRDKLETLTESFLGGKTIQELINDIDEPYKQYNEISKKILSDMSFYTAIQHQVAIRYSAADLMEIYNEVGLRTVNSVVDDSITLSEATDAVANALIEKIKNQPAAAQKEVLKQVFTKANMKEGLDAAIDVFKNRLKTAGKDSHLRKIVKQVLGTNLKGKQQLENNTREIIIKTFEEYFSAKVKEANIVISQNNHYSNYLKEIRKVLVREIDKEFKTGGQFANIFGVGGEGISAAVLEVGNNSLQFTVIGSDTSDQLVEKGFLAHNPNLYNLRSSDKQFYADMRLTNIHNGKTALVQSKNYQGLLNTYLTGDKDIMQQMRLLKEESYVDLMKRIEGTSMGHFDIDELSYIIANEAWFSKYGSINGSTVSLHQNILDAFFTDIMLNYLGLMIDKDLNIIPDISTLFYYIDNKAFVPTYKVIEGLIQRLTDWESEKKIELSTHLNNSSISPKYTSAKEFYEEKRRSLKGKSLLSPNDPDAYTDPALLKIGTEQGAQILETLKIHSINLDVDIKELLTSSYLF